MIRVSGILAAAILSHVSACVAVAQQASEPPLRLVVPSAISPRGAAVSPDGRWLASGGSGNDGFRVWDVRTGAQFLAVAGLRIESVAFSADSRWLLALETFRHPDAGWQRDFRVFDLTTARPIDSAAFRPFLAMTQPGRCVGRVSRWANDTVHVEPAEVIDTIGGRVRTRICAADGADSLVAVGLQFHGSQGGRGIESVTSARQGRDLVVYHADSSVSVVDAASGAVRMVLQGRPVIGIAVGMGSTLVAVQRGPELAFMRDVATLSTPATLVLIVVLIVPLVIVVGRERPRTVGWRVAWRLANQRAQSSRRHKVLAWVVTPVVLFVVAGEMIDDLLVSRLRADRIVVADLDAARVTRRIRREVHWPYLRVGQECAALVGEDRYLVTTPSADFSSIIGWLTNTDTEIIDLRTGSVIATMPSTDGCALRLPAGSDAVILGRTIVWRGTRAGEADVGRVAIADLAGRRMRRLDVTLDRQGNALFGGMIVRERGGNVVAMNPATGDEQVAGIGSPVALSRQGRWIVTETEDSITLRALAGGGGRSPTFSRGLPSGSARTRTAVTDDGAVVRVDTSGAIQLLRANGATSAWKIAPPPRPPAADPEAARRATQTVWEQFRTISPDFQRSRARGWGEVPRTAASSDGRWLAIDWHRGDGRWDCEIQIVDLGARAVVRELIGECHPEFSASGNVLMTSTRAALVVRETRDWTTVSTVPGRFLSATISATGDAIVALRETGTHFNDPLLLQATSLRGNTRVMWRQEHAGQFPIGIAGSVVLVESPGGLTALRLSDGTELVRRMVVDSARVDVTPDGRVDANAAGLRLLRYAKGMALLPAAGALRTQLTPRLWERAVAD